MGHHVQEENNETRPDMTDEPSESVAWDGVRHHDFTLQENHRRTQEINHCLVEDESVCSSLHGWYFPDNKTNQSIANDAEDTYDGLVDSQRKTFLHILKNSCQR